MILLKKFNYNFTFYIFIYTVVLDAIYTSAKKFLKIDSCYSPTNCKIIKPTSLYIFIKEWILSE